MKITQAQFSASSTRIAQKPSQRLPEFAFIGRSNVGKSSLINMLTGTSLAKTSGTPGKTRVVNHFLINNKWYLVDLPGYGYAQASEKFRKHLAAVIDDYINNSEELVMLFVLVDSRHDMQRIDLEFMASLAEREIPFGIIFTKADKLGPVALENQLNKNKERILEDWESLPPVFVTSSQKATGREELLSYIGSILNNLKSC